MRMRRRLSPAALRRLGSDAIPTQAAHLTYTPEGVMIGGPGCGVGGVGQRPTSSFLESKRRNSWSKLAHVHEPNRIYQ